MFSYSNIIPIVKKVVSYILPILLVFAIIIVIRKEHDTIAIAKDISLKTILITSFIFIIFKTVQAVVNLLVIKSTDCSISFSESFSMVFMRSLLNYLPLNAGFISNGIYLKKKLELSFTKFVGITTLYQFLTFLTYGIIGLIVLVILYLNNIKFPPLNFIISFLLLIVPLALIIIKTPKIKDRNRLTKIIIGVQKGWELMRTKHNTLIIIIVLQAITLILTAARYWFICIDLGINISFPIILFINIFGSILRQNTLFPGNLGLREAVAGTIALSFSIDFMDGFIPAAIDHFLSIIIIILIGAPSVLYLSKKLKHAN